MLKKLNKWKPLSSPGNNTLMYTVLEPSRHFSGHVTNARVVFVSLFCLFNEILYLWLCNFLFAFNHTKYHFISSHLGHRISFHFFGCIVFYNLNGSWFVHSSINGHLGGSWLLLIKEVALHTSVHLTFICVLVFLWNIFLEVDLGNQPHLKCGQILTNYPPERLVPIYIYSHHQYMKAVCSYLLSFPGYINPKYFFLPSDKWKIVLCCLKLPLFVYSWN